ncbi:magnesium and cobalt transport protein CorA [Thermobaculum terrenum ATCC BAA-798]|uniref:Magnesium transport protein CorA n=1 Tax=Thermobaculum terrenum (strain ATCC BAA-798 / CCMEE 7001 / YNP1) TaxID=525904 RepID=D1CBN7_THET1|nr:magnesium/cobalt transporter CorA [Thermobaculum terrenum]ACZ42202.1 magnesium and cobalt transport protein CorA [Thermobaculum terrenum ATCC BAA-798]
MFKIMLSKEGSELVPNINIEDISDVISRENNLLWVDAISPSKNEMEKLQEEFGFHELSIEDALKPWQRPKIDQYDSYYFIVIYTARFIPEQVDIQEVELDIFLGRNYIVTVHGEEISELNDVARRWQQNISKLKPSAGVLLYSIIDSIVDSYFPLVDTLGDHIERFEETIFSGRQITLQGEVFRLRKELLQLRRVLGPQRDLLLHLSRMESALLEGDVRTYFQDVYDHIMRVTDTIDLYRDLLNSVLESYLTVASNNLNITVRTLTSWSIILMTLALIAGIYGMNFEHMPELHWRYGYPGVLLIMLLITVILYYYFKRRRWL